jgi:hypothetical protein
MATYYRDDQTSITVTLNGTGYPGWDAWDGGNLDSNTVKYRTLAAGEVDLGGPPSRGDSTVTIQASDVVVASWWPAFENAAGNGKVSLSVKFLDANGAVQATHTRTGILKGVTPSGMDRSNQSPGRATFAITVAMDEKAVS